MRLKICRQDHADLMRDIVKLKKARAVVGEGAVASGRSLTEQERTAFIKLGGEIENLEKALAQNDAELVQLEARNEAERNYRGPTDDADEMASRAALARAGIRVDRPWEPSRGSASPREGQLTHTQLHGSMHASLGQWRDPAEIFRIVGNGLNDPRLRAAGQGGESDVFGGYALPVATEMQIFDGAVPASIFLSRANVRPMKTRTQDVVTFDRSGDGAAGTMFGLKFQFIAEGGEGATVQTASLRKISMTANTASILFDASNELLADASDFESGLLQAVEAATAYGIDKFCLNGVGVGCPTGVRNLPSLITVAKEPGQAADTIVYTNLLKMFSRLPAASMGRAAWLAHQSCIPALASLTVPVGTGGSFIPAMTESGGMFRLLLQPVVFSDLCQPLGDVGDISLLDLSQYTIGMRAGMAIERSIHVGFAKNRLTFRLLVRFDGNSGWAQAYQPENNAPTQSPFIQLAAR